MSLPPQTRYSVLLVSTGRAGAIGLRELIRESTDLNLLAEVSPGPEAVSIARQAASNVIVVASDGMTDELVVLLTDLRSASASSALLVCTDERDPKILLRLNQLAIEGILRWADITAAVLDGVLRLIGSDIWVMSAAVGREVAGARAHGSTGLVVLTEREEAVLRTMCWARSQKEIADSLGLSERTVHGIIAALKRKLGARTTFMLGVWAHALGAAGTRRDEE